MKETCYYYVCASVCCLLFVFFSVPCVKLGSSHNPVFNTYAYVYIKQSAYLWSAQEIFCNE